MVGIDPRQLAELEWRQPSALSRSYELKSGDSVLATLKFTKTLGTLATASASGSVWTFKRTGFLNPVVTARAEGSDSNLAEFRAKWTARSGSLEMATGESLVMRALNFWGSEWGVEDGQGRLLMKIHEKGVVHSSARYEVTEIGRLRQDLGLLLCLSWYVLILMAEDSAA